MLKISFIRKRMSDDGMNVKILTHSVNDNKWYPKVVVLGPGGMEGFLELGLLAKFSNLGLLNNVHTYIGCSAGAIISLMIIAGYTPAEIIADAREIDLFHDISSLKINDLKSLFTIIRQNFGLLSHNMIKERLTQRMRQKFGFIPTLYKLYLATDLTLITVSLNLNSDKTEYFSWRTHPDLSVIDATILSMNIPFLFYKLKYHGNIYIDGAFGDPYPVNLLDDGKTNILGIFISSDNPDAYHKKSLEDDDLRYLNKVLHASMTQIKNKNQITASDKVKHLMLYSPTIDITGISYDNEVKKQMILIGYQEAIKFAQSVGWQSSFNVSDISEMSEIQKLLDEEEGEEEEEEEEEGGEELIS